MVTDGEAAQNRPHQNEAMLTRLLLAWAQAKDDAQTTIETEIRSIFEETHAILVLDMSGFSSTVIRRGILHFLAKIHEMRAAVLPVIRAHGGRLVKFIGDDVIALFPDVDTALHASREIRDGTRMRPPLQPPGFGFRVAIGIGYGPLLYVPGKDIWGNEVNLAFKLGEDTAGADEILLTRAAYDALSAPPTEFQQLIIEASGIEIIAYQAP